MSITKLKARDFSGDEKLKEIYAQFGDVLAELNAKKLPQHLIESINQDVDEINGSALTEKDLRRLVNKKQTKIISEIEKRLKIVPKDHYRNLWLALGMTAFGLPIGVAIGLSTGNMGLLAIGLPIGLGLGVVVGSRLDKKAAEEGRQLQVAIKQ